MDEDKKKRLEEIREQLNPDILAKVAESMGKSPVPSPDAATPSSGGQKVRLNVKNVRKKFDYTAPQKTKKSISLVISSDFIKGRTLQNSIKKMQFDHVELVEDAKAAFELILKAINSKKKINIILINLDSYLQFKKIVGALPEEKTGFLRNLPIVIAVPEQQKAIYVQLREAGLKNVILYPQHLKNKDEFTSAIEIDL